MPWRSPSEEGTSGIQVSNLCCPLLFTRLLFLSVLVTKATEPVKLRFLFDEDRRAWSPELHYFSAGR